jgi:site-specific recombinase XerD
MLIEKYKQQRLNTTTLHKRKRSPATVNRELQVLSEVFSMAYDNGLVETNPMRRVHKLREAPARERYLTDEEEKSLFAILVGEARSHPPDRGRRSANWHAARGNPELEMGERRFRARHDLCCSHKNRPTS